MKKLIVPLLILVLSAVSYGAKTSNMGYTYSPFFGDGSRQQMHLFYWATGMGEADDDTTNFGAGDTTLAGFSRGWPTTYPHAGQFTKMNVLWMDSSLGGDDSIGTYLLVQCRTFGFLGVDTLSNLPDNDAPWYTWKIVSSAEYSNGVASFDSIGDSFKASRREGNGDIFLPVCDELRIVRVNDAYHDSATQTIWATLKR